MRIALIEPQSTKYIHINHRTNTIYLFIPFVAGSEISTDNTCKAHTELLHFVGQKGALHELMSFQQDGNWLVYPMKLKWNGKVQMLFQLISFCMKLHEVRKKKPILD